MKSSDVAALLRVTYRLIIFDLDGTLVTTASGDHFRGAWRSSARYTARASNWLSRPIRAASRSANIPTRP